MSSFSSFSSFSSPRNPLESLAYPSMTSFQICPLGYIFNQSIYDNINNRDNFIYENNNADKSDYVWNEINFIDINNNYEIGRAHV